MTVTLELTQRELQQITYWGRAAESDGATGGAEYAELLAKVASQMDADFYCTKCGCFSHPDEDKCWYCERILSQWK